MAGGDFHRRPRPPYIGCCRQELEGLAAYSVTVSRVGWFSRSIRPPDEPPNSNAPAAVPPGTVGPPALSPGDPHGLTIDTLDAPPSSPPTITPSAWAGWPA